MKKYHMVLPFVSGIIVNHKGEILIGKQSNKPGKPYPGRWDLPGGKLEPNESVTKCLKREVKEETGYDVEEARLFDVFHHNTNAFLEDYKGGIAGLGIIYIVRVSGEYKPTEMVEVHFASKEEIEKLDFTPWAKASLLKYFENMQG